MAGEHPQRDYVFVSDLHLSLGYDADRRAYHPREDFFFDEVFFRWLRWLDARCAEGRRSQLEHTVVDRDGTRLREFADEVLTLLGELGVDPRRGLPAAEVAARRRRYGPNRIQETRRRGPLRRIADSSRDGPSVWDDDRHGVPPAR